MRVLAASVLAMESLVMGFAILLAMKDHSALALTLGGFLAILLILSAGLLKKKAGWVLGSTLQVALLAYGLVVTAMYLIGAIFAGLWIAAIIGGRKGEAARAAFLASPPPDA